MVFSSTILSWYAKNKRDLPWRGTTDPYKIWLSEVMLQQTRVAQGMPYYFRFLENFPTIFDLANADEERILKLWQGLGYYSRARNLHQTAKFIAFNRNGVFPDSYNELLKLKGIGDYTASAIASICFKELQPVVDGNVYRVLSRYFGIDTPINSSKGIKLFKQLAREVMDKNEISSYNQGLMEFGAIQCKPQTPDCSNCVLNASCMALSTGRVNELPVKIKNKKAVKRFFNYVVPIDPLGNTLLSQRDSSDIWKKLYEFPLIETAGRVSMNEMEKRIRKSKRISGDFELSIYNEKPVIHKLSHQHLITTFWIVHLQSSLNKSTPLKKVKEYPLPVLMANFVEEAGF